jgi:hypothetical protein
MKTFLIVFGGTIDRDELGKFLETLPGHENWFYSIPHCMFETSSSTAEQLVEQIRNRFGKEMRIFATPITGSQFFGYLPSDHVPEIKK